MRLSCICAGVEVGGSNCAPALNRAVGGAPPAVFFVGAGDGDAPMRGLAASLVPEVLLDVVPPDELRLVVAVEVLGLGDVDDDVFSGFVEDTDDDAGFELAAGLLEDDEAEVFSEDGLLEFSVLAMRRLLNRNRQRPDFTGDLE